MGQSADVKASPATPSTMNSQQSLARFAGMAPAGQGMPQIQQAQPGGGMPFSSMIQPGGGAFSQMQNAGGGGGMSSMQNILSQILSKYGNR